MLTTHAPPPSVAPPTGTLCPRCQLRIEWSVAVASTAASRVVLSGPDADAVAAEAQRIARDDLARVGCWG